MARTLITYKNVKGKWYKYEGRSREVPRKGA